MLIESFQSLKLKSSDSSVNSDNDINGYNINLYYILGIIDGLLFLWALFQLIRILIYSRNGAKNLKPKLIFHFIIAVTMLVRSGFFFSSQKINNYDIVLIWYEVSSMLLFVGYGCLLLFWMELYSRFSQPFSTAKDFWNIWIPRVIVFTTIIVLALVGWIVTLTIWGKSEDRRLLLDQIIEGIISGLFLVAGFGFLIYGILLFVSFKKLDKHNKIINDDNNKTKIPNGNNNETNRNNSNSNNIINISGGISSNSKTHLLVNGNSGVGKRRKGLLQSPPEAIRAAVVGSICTVCFCIRSIITLYSIRESINDPNQSGTTSFNLGWEFELAYFFMTEILPTVLMMFRLRKMKKKRNLLLNDPQPQQQPQQQNNRYSSQYSLLTSASFNQLVKSTKSNGGVQYNNINSPLILKHNEYDNDSSSSSSYSSSNNDSDEESSSESSAIPPSYKTTILPH
ncbi:hypothetical protein RB653_010231 [Dictyostelium firmibasis]|uniref:THH1/TOM1/TOM3 domain-containing protein n=1 Tax=Dictyostelium firmibasis TaxID=79012 RepID=A0AAN7TRZ0_9MYCE